jgi:tetratricopeptide (TPR) repeat protein
MALKFPHCDNRSQFLSALLCAALLLIVGCADPAPIPPQPKVEGLDTYAAGVRALKDGNTHGAQTLLERAVEVNPNLTMAHQLLGDVYRKESNYAKASDQYAAYSRLDPYNFKSHYDLGLAYQLMGRLADAVDAYIQALLLAPRDLNANMNLGLAYLSLNRVDDAIRQLEFAVKIDPHSAAAECNLGVALETGGQLDQAQMAYRRAMELDPAQTFAMVDLGALLVRQGQGREAQTVLEAVVKKADSAVVRKRLGDSLVLQAQDDAAMQQYDLCLKIDPNYWPAMNEMGLIDIRKYQAGMTLHEDLRLGAVALWKKSLSLQPHQTQIQQLLDRWNQNGQMKP